MRRIGKYGSVVKKLPLLLIALALFALSCGNDEPDIAELTGRVQPVPVLPTPLPTVDIPAITDRFDARVQAVLDTTDWCQIPPLLAESDNDLSTMDVFEPLEVEANLTGRSELLAAAVAQAPAELLAAVTATADGADQIRELFAAAEWDALDVDLVQLEGIDTAMTLPAFNLARYNFDECGIGEDPGVAPVVEGEGIESLFGGDATSDEIVDELVSRGFEPDGAACLVDSFELQPGETVTNSGNLVEAFNECELPIQLFAVVDQ